MHELQRTTHKINVLMSAENRKDQVFTPWLANAKTNNRQRAFNHLGTVHTVNSLDFVVSTEHVSSRDYDALIKHPKSKSSAHYASFDVRIAGVMERTLMDSGATPSCMSLAFAKRLGLYVEPNPHHENEIGGVGGTVSVIGTVSEKVKIGKRQDLQLFLVVKEPIAGYHVLLGQNFMARNYVTLGFSPTSVRFEIGTGSDQVVMKRAIETSLRSEVCSVTPTSLLPEPEPSRNFLRREFNNLQKDIKCNRQVAYTILLNEITELTKLPKSALPKCIQQVLDRHSVPGGTLCGKIPNNTSAHGFQAHIELEPGAGAVHVKQYRLTPLEKTELIEQVNEFIRKGWIELSSSPWSSSVLFIPKPNGKLRFCLDYRRLNARTVKDSGNIPLMPEMLDELAGASLFSALDLASGYYQLALDNNSRPLTAFPTPYGLYQWTVMPMGLCNAPAIFQRAMNTILRTHIDAGYCLVYLDDIIIKSNNHADHAKHIDAVLTSLHTHNLFCQLPKCHWAETELKYLGHLIDGRGVRPDPAKVATLDRWQPPLKDIEALTNSDLTPKLRRQHLDNIASECRRFLGFMNYFNRFIPRYSELCFSLTNQTHINPPKWTDECARAWNQLKSLLSKATLMYHPDFTKPFHVYSDASIRAIGGVLIQNHNGVDQPVAYVARKLTSAEVNYTTTEQEMLAMVYCFTQWRCYLEGTQVILHTDHEPLSWLQSQQMLNRRQARWMEYFQRFKYIVAYIKGDKNVVADALTRNLDIEIGMPDNDLPYQAWPHTSLQEVNIIVDDNSMHLDVCPSSTDVVLEFRTAFAPEPESTGFQPFLVGLLRELNLRAEHAGKCDVPNRTTLTKEDALLRIHRRFGLPIQNPQPATPSHGDQAHPSIRNNLAGRNRRDGRSVELRPVRVRFAEEQHEHSVRTVLSNTHSGDANLGRPHGRHIPHPVLDGEQRHRRGRSKGSTPQPDQVRTPANGGLPTGTTGVHRGLPRRSSRRVVPVSSSRDGHGVFRGEPKPLGRVNRTKCTKQPMHSSFDTSDMPVCKHARMSNFPVNNSGSELQTSLENISGGVDFPQVSLFNSQPDAYLSVNDNMHNPTDPVCDVPVNDLVNPELSRNSLMNFSNPELPQTQPTDTHSPSLRSSASHTESGGGEIRHELDPSLSNYEVLCEQLFDRIKKLLILDEATNSQHKREKMHLHMHNELL